MAGNKKEHTRDIGTRCSRTRQREVNFCRSRGTRGKRNVARKRISPINCQSNLATQKIPLPLLLRSATSLLRHILPSEFSFARRRKLAPAHRPSRFFFVALFHPSATEFARCSFDNDRAKCKCHRVGNLTDLLPSQNYVKHPRDDEEDGILSL